MWKTVSSLGKWKQTEPREKANMLVQREKGGEKGGEIERQSNTEKLKLHWFSSQTT